MMTTTDASVIVFDSLMSMQNRLTVGKILAKMLLLSIKLQRQSLYKG